MQVTNMSGRDTLFDGTESECWTFIQLFCYGKSVKLINGKYHRKLTVNWANGQWMRQYGEWNYNPLKRLAGPVTDLSA